MSKILAIDDKRDNLVALSALLKNLMADCTVIAAPSGSEGIALAQRELPDVILLDVKMPDMDGFETCRRLKTDPGTAGIPVIMITAIKTDSQSRIKGLELGADAFLAKPIDELELVSQVRVALRIKSAEDALRRERDSLEQLVAERTASLKESEKKYKLFIQTAIDGFWLLDLEGRLLQVNDAYCELSGYSAEELLTLRIADLEAFETDADAAAHIQKVVARGQDRFESRHRRKDGQTIDVEISARHLCIEGGRIVAFLSDITNRKQAEAARLLLEERLQRAQKMEALGQLAGGVAHDLNNVLGITMAYAELLGEQTAAGSRQKEYAESILSSTEKAAAIIQDMLTLARRGVSVSKVVDLNGIVSALLTLPEFLKLQDFHPFVTFRADLDKDLLPIKGSPVHLEKSVFNLIANAAEAITGRGGIVIRTENRYLDNPVGGYEQVEEGEYAVLTVSDTGQGIAAGELNKIFEPFYTKKSMGKSGTGLGLAIVWGTVKDHDGYIDVRSEEDKGTTFTLYFPITREEIVQESAPLPIENYRGQGESVLVVDDVEEQRQVAATLLTGLGYTVYTLGSGEEAIEYLQRRHSDILVLDMIMGPGMDGLETYQRVLEVQPRQKAIIVSGFAETDRVKEALNLGADSYVKKPYLRERIGMAVRQALDRRQTGGP